MAKCNFSIPFTGNPEGLISQANSAISGYGGSFTGDNTQGQFNISSPLGKISGSYTILGQAFNISIEDKPMFISCGRIEDELKKYIK